MLFTQNFLPFNLNHLVLDQSFSFFYFPLHSNVDCGRCWFVFVRNWIMPPEMAISLKNCRVEQQNQSFLSNWTAWAISSHCSLWLLSSLSVHLSLGSTAPFGRPSASLKFFHSLIPPHPHSVSLCAAAQNNSRRRSLSMLVLSCSDTHYLNRHMAWCGCHEILIPRYLTVPFLSNFLWGVVNCLSILSVPL